MNCKHEITLRWWLESEPKELVRVGNASKYIELCWGWRFAGAYNTKACGFDL